MRSRPQRHTENEYQRSADQSDRDPHAESLLSAHRNERWAVLSLGPRLCNAGRKTFDLTMSEIATGTLHQITVGRVETP